MAFTKPGEFGLGASSGTISTLTFQPIAQEVVESPRQGRRDGGIVAHGWDSEVWIFCEGDVALSNAQFQTLMGHYNTAKSNGGRIWARTWDAEASSGGGAWANYRFIMERPRGRIGGADGLMFDVRLVLRARGIPS